MLMGGVLAASSDDARSWVQAVLGAGAALGGAAVTAIVARLGARAATRREGAYYVEITAGEQARVQEFDETGALRSDNPDSPQRPQRSATDVGTDALVDRYHAQVLGQSSISFAVSLAVAIFGFMLLTAAVILVLAGGHVDAATFSTISGAITETVSALFFRQANKARQTMVTFYESVETGRAQDRRMTRALELVETIDNARERNRMKAEMIRTLTLGDAPAVLPASGEELGPSGG